MSDRFSKIKDVGIDKLNLLSKHYLFDHLSMKFSAIGEGWVEMIMPVTEKVLQPMKILHGGVNFLVCETIASILSYAMLENDDEFIVGTELSGSHIRSCRTGDVVTAQAILIQAGNQLHRWRFELRQQEGKPTFAGQMTTMVQRRSQK